MDELPPQNFARTDLETSSELVTKNFNFWCRIKGVSHTVLFIMVFRHFLFMLYSGGSNPFALKKLQVGSIFKPKYLKRKYG